MSTVSQCDNCGEMCNPNRVFTLHLPHMQGKYDFCNTICLIKYIEKEWNSGKCIKCGDIARFSSVDDKDDKDDNYHLCEECYIKAKDCGH